jgi:hypothetical protein
MLKRKEIEKLSQSFKALEEKQDKLSDEQDALNKKLDVLLSDLLLEEDILKDSEWRFVSPGATNIDYVGDINTDPLYNNILSLLPNKNYTWIQLEDGIHLSLDEEYFSISFDELHKIIPFSNKYKIKISGKSIIDRLREIKREASQLEKICHQFQIKE